MSAKGGAAGGGDAGDRKDAAELIEIDYEVLAPTTTPRRRPRRRTTRVGRARSNILVDAEVGDAAATDKAFADAAHVVKLETWVQRVTGVPMEARAAVGNYDKQSGPNFLHAAAAAWCAESELAGMLGSSLRMSAWSLTTSAANFGTKNSIFAEFRWCCGLRSGLAARQIRVRTQRSVPQRLPGRDLVAKVELHSTGGAAFSPCAARISATLAATPPRSCRLRKA